MSAQEMPVERSAGIGTPSETPTRRDHDLVVEPPGPFDIPPAFYRDDEAPPPPPSDPHWREWPFNDGPEPIPREILVGLPVALGVLGILHILAILLVLHFSGLY